jgi:hypothetical protein
MPVSSGCACLPDHRYYERIVPESTLNAAPSRELDEYSYRPLMD